MSQIPQDSLNLPVRVLYVEDEPALLLTWREILRKHGYQVTTAASVEQAKELMNTNKFEVLLSDFHISREGDGLAVASAFKKANADGVTIILTGYPDIDGALSLVHAHIDTYLVKPAEVKDVIDTIDRYVLEHRSTHTPHHHSLEDVLRGESASIQEEWLKQVRANAQLAAIKISNRERLDHLPEILREVSEPGKQAHEHKLEAARKHGAIRRRQGYTVGDLAEESRLLRRTIFLVLQRNLMEVNFSQVFPDLLKVTDSLEAQLKESLLAYVNHKKAA